MKHTLRRIAFATSFANVLLLGFAPGALAETSVPKAIPVPDSETGHPAIRLPLDGASVFNRLAVAISSGQQKYIDEILKNEGDIIRSYVNSGTPKAIEEVGNLARIQISKAYRENNPKLIAALKDPRIGIKPETLQAANSPESLISMTLRAAYANDRATGLGLVEEKMQHLSGSLTTPEETAADEAYEKEMERRKAEARKGRAYADAVNKLPKLEKPWEVRARAEAEKLAPQTDLFAAVLDLGLKPTNEDFQTFSFRITDASKAGRIAEWTDYLEAMKNKTPAGDVIEQKTAEMIADAYQTSHNRELAIRYPRRFPSVFGWINIVPEHTDRTLTHYGNLAKQKLTGGDGKSPTQRALETRVSAEYPSIPKAQPIPEDDVSSDVAK